MSRADSRREELCDALFASLASGGEPVAGCEEYSA